jgi:PIN domain nuclease of toxin-antitoxin system
VRILLDTHVLLWWKGDTRRLSREARQRLGRSDGLLVSPVSLWEIATLLQHGRIGLDRDLDRWVDDLLAEGSVAIATLTPPAAVLAGGLPDDFPGDPADRLIYATAIDVNLALLSKDENLHRIAERDRRVRVIW